MLKEIYNEHKEEIEKRLKDFSENFNLDDERLFGEMVFCMLTPQTKAHAGWKATLSLLGSTALFNNDELIPKILSESGVRFHKNKTRYILENREKFYPNTKMMISSYLNKYDTMVEVRNALKEDVKGWGYKEASHFLRNIGFGKDLAILDRHILRTLVSNGVTPEIPKNLNKEYLEIEQKMVDFSKSLDIPQDAMDLVIWYSVNGEFFK